MWSDSGQTLRPWVGKSSPAYNHKRRERSVLLDLRQELSETRIMVEMETTDCGSSLTGVCLLWQARQSSSYNFIWMSKPWIPHCTTVRLNSKVQKGFISSTQRPSACSWRQADLQGEAKANPASRSAGKPPDPEADPQGDTGDLLLSLVF